MQNKRFSMFLVSTISGGDRSACSGSSRGRFSWRRTQALKPSMPQAHTRDLPQSLGAVAAVLPNASLLLILFPQPSSPFHSLIQPPPDQRRHGLDSLLNTPFDRIGSFARHPSPCGAASRLQQSIRKLLRQLQTYAAASLRTSHHGAAPN